MMSDTTLQKIESNSTKTDNTPNHLPVNLLKMLFDRLDIPVQTGELNHACKTVQNNSTEEPPAQRIGLILQAMRIEVQVSQLRWNRFDQRRLPVLLFLDGQWLLIEGGAKGQLTSTCESGKSHDYSEDQLDGGIVLWLKPITRKKKSSFPHK